MPKKNIVLTRILLFSLFSFSFLFPQENLSEYLTPLKPLLGKTWKAPVSKASNGDPVYDIACWKRILNGNGVKITHSVNDGDYGGETTIVWDKKAKSLVFYYFTTAGFYTNGTITIQGEKIVTVEKVAGNQDGITEVKSTMMVKADGKLYTSTQFLKNEKWTGPKDVIYEEASNAKVVFR